MVEKYVRVKGRSQVDIFVVVDPNLKLIPAVTLLLCPFYR